MSVGLYQRLHAALLAKRCACYDRAVEPRKRPLLGAIAGKVLEIGAGTGANLPFFRPGIQWVGIEPNPYMHALPVADASVDAVVSSLVLCTVGDVAQALREILRVLKPGGRFVFIEHVAATPGSWTRRIQRAIQPLWSVVGDGCRPDRETWTAIQDAGFARVDFAHFRVPVPIAGPHIAGIAIK